MTKLLAVTVYALALMFQFETAVAATNYRALLIGVSEYPSLAATLQLSGPKNDVLRAREVLVRRGVEPSKIKVLADGVPDAALPTRANILAELNLLASTARPGDYIVLMMAGHGSQQPVPTGSAMASAEPDGLFEIFLPRDTGSWANLPSGRGGEVKNAIVDHEIRAFVDKMTASGAFVWGIFDTCHSATLVRSGNEVVLRQVKPSTLGVPDNEIESARVRAAQTSPPEPRLRTAAVKPPGGGSVFFYASQTTEPTEEMPMPAGHPQRVTHGFFSYSVISAIDGGAAMTYRQLAQHVLTQYGGMGAARATPVFTGTALDQAVLGQASLSVRQWLLSPGNNLTIPAGLLADIREGAVFAILPTPVSRIEDALGFARAEKITFSSADLVPIAYGDTPLRDQDLLRKGAIARLVQSALQFGLTVSVDLSDCAKPCQFESALKSLRAMTETTGTIPRAQIQWAGMGRASDIQLKATGDRLWLLPPTYRNECAVMTGEKKQTCDEQRIRSWVSIEAQPGATTNGLKEAIGAALHSATRSANLMRIATSLSSTSAIRKLKVTIDIEVSGVDSPGKKRISYQVGSVPTLKAGDRAIVTIENLSEFPLDVTALYLDSRFGISVLFPTGMGSNRLEKGARNSLVLEIDDSTLGVERLAIIAVEAQKRSERADFSFLAQPALSSQGVPRGSVPDSTAVFRDAGFAEFKTRAIKQAMPSTETGMQVFSWRISK